MAFQAARADEGDVHIRAISDPAHPGMLGWKVEYEMPSDLHDLEITLFYNFWDPKVDGDAYSRVKLNAFSYRNAAGTVAFTVFLNAKRSILQVAGLRPAAGAKSCPLDATFAVAKVPKRGSGGAIVLCQKPVDPKQPAPMGDTQDAAAWIELGIAPQP
jgi:hypothetical protein